MSGGGGERRWGVGEGDLGGGNVACPMSETDMSGLSVSCRGRGRRVSRGPGFLGDLGSEISDPGSRRSHIARIRDLKAREASDPQESESRIRSRIRVTVPRGPVLNCAIERRSKSPAAGRRLPGTRPVKRTTTAAAAADAAAAAAPRDASGAPALGGAGCVAEKGGRARWGRPWLRRTAPAHRRGLAGHGWGGGGGGGGRGAAAAVVSAADGESGIRSENDFQRP